MKKNDKLVVILGVVILILAAVGIYYWVPQETVLGTASIDDFFKMSGVFSDTPRGIVVSDTCPFYPLIVTPLAIHYDIDGNQEVAPLFIENSTNPSTAVMNIESIINIDPDIIIGDSISPKDASIILAKDYWKKSEGALIIENNQIGYELGILATPIASYLSIPIIVTDEIDDEVEKVLRTLEVTRTIVCGEELEGYGDVLKFENVDDIVDAQIELVLKKFGKVGYITITNPIDAWPPKVLDSFSTPMGPITLESVATTRFLYGSQATDRVKLGTFEIPEDYKYALIKFEGYNLDCEDVDDFGDSVAFSCGANLPDIPKQLMRTEVFSQSTATGGIAVRDANGKLIEDKLYVEAVLYDRGGVEYTVRSTGSWLLKKTGRVAGTITVEKLEHPVYATMKKLSSIAPYLTAYHQGIVFGKKEFAFTADDDVISSETGKSSPGYFMPNRNPRIVENSNYHIYDNIITPLNNILAKLSEIELKDDTDLEDLRDYYAEDPVHIALVGDATVIPNYIYDNYLVPVDYDKAAYGFGPGTPSDVIYGNIDPKPYDWSNKAKDVFTDYPYQENIVGRITGWDSQDASALVARSVFYNDIIDKLDKWKESMAVLVGDGIDFRDPPIRSIIGKITGSVFHGLMKMWTGFGEIALENIVETVGKPAGFNTFYTAYKEPASLQGFSDDDLRRLKWETGLHNKLNLAYVSQFRNIVGDGVVIGGKAIKNSNFVFINGHGNKNILAMDGIDLVVSGFGGPIINWIMKKVLEVVSPYAGPGASLASHIQYGTRDVVRYNFNPSVVWLDSCICGKIDGIYPETSLGQAFLHSGFAALIASPTESNIPGGYLEPKFMRKDLPSLVLLAYLKTKLDARRGIYPDKHFGILIYSDMVKHLTDEDSTIGMAFREAKNKYLDQDDDWMLWWSPPLVKTSSLEEEMELQNSYPEELKNSAEKLKMMENKYMSYQEYMLFGDPALNPYVPKE